MDYTNFEKTKAIYLEKCKKTILKIANEFSENNKINEYFLRKALFVFLINNFEDLEQVIYHDETEALIDNIDKYENIEFEEEILHTNKYIFETKKYLLTKEALCSLNYYIDCINTYIDIQSDPELNKNNPKKILLNKNTSEWWKRMIIETRIPFVDMNFANFNIPEYKYIIYINQSLMEEEEEYEEEYEDYGELDYEEDNLVININKDIKFNSSSDSSDISDSSDS